jgi:hypothetical protein
VIDIEPGAPILELSNLRFLTIIGLYCREMTEPRSACRFVKLHCYHSTVQPQFRELGCLEEAARPAGESLGIAGYFGNHFSGQPQDNARIRCFTFRSFKRRDYFELG